MRTWKDVDSGLLDSIPHPNPSGEMEVVHVCPEVTFLGVPSQPDFATLEIKMVPHALDIELKSLKEFLFDWRTIVVSYERFLYTVHEILWNRYEPKTLTTTLVTAPRGGISSRLQLDGAPKGD